MESVSLDESFKELGKTFKSGRTRSASWRKSQLRALLKLLQEKEEDLFAALKQDLGKHHVEAFRDEVGFLIKSANLALKSVDQWMASNKVSLPWLAFPNKGEVVPEPLGLVLIFTSWNFPIGLALEPLIGAITAGNAVLLKPSELAPASSSFLANIIPTYLDNQAVKVVEGGATVGEQLLDKKWDKIFFTGSARVGSIIMSAAAKHLTPVVLELGGKCPAIVDWLSISRNREVAVGRIVGGKYGPCGGQACIGIDYLLVEEKFASELVDLMRVRIKKFYGENPCKTNGISRIINKQHFLRLVNLLKEPAVAASIVHGGSVDEDNLFIEPTILLDPPLEAEIMTEEIFGPLLPIITLNKIHDCIEFINSRPKALAIYVFTNDETLKKKVVSDTSSGSVTFNDCIIQFVCDALPFGGVGQSGFGKYHGKFSFDTFSHGKAVLRRLFSIEYYFQFPPWNDHKLRMIRAAYNFDYFGVVLEFLGLKKY